MGAQKAKDLSPKRDERTLGISRVSVSDDDLRERLGVYTVRMLER